MCAVGRSGKEGLGVTKTGTRVRGQGYDSLKVVVGRGLGLQGGGEADQRGRRRTMEKRVDVRHTRCARIPLIHTRSAVHVLPSNKNVRFPTAGNDAFGLKVSPAYCWKWAAWKAVAV